MQTHHVFLESPLEDNHIVDVGRANLPVQPIEYKLHHTFNRSRGVSQAKGHDLEVVKAKWSCERRLLDVTKMDKDLSVTTCKIEGGKPILNHGVHRCRHQ